MSGTCNARFTGADIGDDCDVQPGLREAFPLFNVKDNNLVADRIG